MILLYEKIGTEIFGKSKIVEILGCSETTAMNYIKRMHDELHIINAVEGSGKGKYTQTSHTENGLLTLKTLYL